MTTALRLLPPLAWSALIAWFSGASFSAGATAPYFEPWLRAIAPWATSEQIAALHWLLRKAGHVVEYAVLALLWSRALSRESGTRAWRRPLVLAAVTAGLDELHQATTLTREGSLADVLLDVTGASVALRVAIVGVRGATDGLARVLLWIAAAGGTLCLVINLAAAAPSGLLWLCVPAAWVSLWYWRRGRA